MRRENGQRDGFLAAGAIAAVVASIPFLRTFLGGYVFYFRDLSAHFLPVRRFVLEGLAKGEWRYWNPFVHEGEPLVVSPFGYLPDLLQLLSPNEFGISLTLALHIPFAAVAFVLLARELRATPTAASLGGIVYSLGGFALSSINLYFYVQTLAWAPLFVIGFRRAVERGGGRALALGALATGMMVSTAGVELIIQAGLLALLITPPATLRQWLRATGVIVLGSCLAALVVAPLIGLNGASERADGFRTAVVLSNSVSPLSFFQVLIAGFFGDPSNSSGRWWGLNFFPNGFPYFLSLYLGPTVLALAMAGAISGKPLSRRLALAVVLGVFVCLGQFAGWSALFDLSPSLRFMRFPVKAFFTIHFSVALLASFAVDAMRTHTRGLRNVALIGAVLGGAIASIRLLPILAPDWVQWFLSGFLPTGTAVEVKVMVADLVPSDAFTAGMVALVAALICLAASFERVSARSAVVAVTALVAADLMRAGAGLNPSVTRAFYDLSPGMARQVETMRTEGRRYFICHSEASPAYWRARQIVRPRHAWSMGMVQETLTPASNTARGVTSAFSPDTTGVSPPTRTLPNAIASCSNLDLLLPRLHSAGVSRLLSLDSMTHKDLRLVDEVAPERIAPLIIHIYEVSDPQPRFNMPVSVVKDVPGHLTFSVDAPLPSDVLVRDPFVRGWEARVNGSKQPIVVSPEGYKVVSVPAGRSEVRLDFALPGLRPGLVISGLSVLVCFALLIFSRKAPEPASL